MLDTENQVLIKRPNKLIKQKINLYWLCAHEVEVSANQVRFSAAAERRLESIGGNVGNALNVGGSVQKASERNSLLVELRTLPVTLLASGTCAVPFTSPLGLQICAPPPLMLLTTSFEVLALEAEDVVVVEMTVDIVIPGLRDEAGGSE